MDTLAAFLDGPRARGAFVLRAVLDPPWGLRVEDEAPLTLVAVVRGRLWVVLDDGRRQPVEAGDVAMLSGPAPYTVADAPGSPPMGVVGPDQVARGPDGSDLCDAMRLGGRSWGTGPDGECVLMIGTYERTDAVGRRLLDALPPLAVVRRHDWRASLLDLLEQESLQEAPGQDAVVDRLLDLVLVSVVRAWLARPDTDTPTWYAAHTDPVVGRVLRLVESSPERGWTVASLATEVGLSRAAFARRFADVAGEPPMTYLTRWRLNLAADLLTEPGSTLDAVARRVGYGSGLALSVAFKRERGITPRDHRSGSRAGHAGGHAVPPATRRPVPGTVGRAT